VRELEVDLGNTYAKWRLCSEGVAGSVEQGDLSKLNSVLSEYRPERVLISSVASSEKNEQLAASMSSLDVDDIYWATTSAAAAGVTNGYLEYQKLGVDRWLVCLAAYSLRAVESCVIDFGSAITVDFISLNGVHRGGYIVPGVDLCFKALAQNTGNLQGEYEFAVTGSPGLTTKSGIEHGVYLMQLGFIKEVLSSFSGEKIYCTGGGFFQFSKALVGYPIEYIDSLVFKGLRLSYKAAMLNGKRICGG